MSTQFSEHFGYKRLLKIVYPSVVMMVFTSIYGVVDGVFVSNFAGSTAFAAVNLIMPVLMAFAAFGFMIGTGGAALVSKIMGEEDPQRAKAVFSLLIYVTVGLGLILTGAGIAVLSPLAKLFGAEGEMLDDCVLYGTINMCGMTLFMLQNVFQSFFPVAGKPKLGLAFVVAAGLTNAALDAVFIACFGWGIAGAAAATVSGQAVGGLAPVIYFFIKRRGAICLGRPAKDIRAVIKAFTNGSSEMMTNLSLSFVNILYNYQLMRFVGENGVAAYGVIMYVGFIFVSVYLGYSVGVTPIIGFNYGAQNREELKNLLKKSLVIIAITAGVMLGLALSLCIPLCKLFVSYDKELYALTEEGFFIYSFAYLLVGFNIFGSSFFTALNNGAVSAVISFLRTLLLQVLCIMVLPELFGLYGVWTAPIAAEALSIIVTVSFISGMRKKYGY